MKNHQILENGNPPLHNSILLSEISSTKPVKKEKSTSKKIQFRYKDQSMESESPRPVLSYNELIIEAIKSSNGGMLSLQDIYDYIQDSYDYFKKTTVAWQNSIRHNLSVQKIFERVPRPASMPGKGGLWRLTPAYEIETRSSEEIQAEINSRDSFEKKKPANQSKRIRKRKRKYDSDDDEIGSENSHESDFGASFSMSNTPRKRHTPVKMIPQSAPPSTNHYSFHKEALSANKNNNSIESTGGTLVNSPFVTTSKLNPHEYQGTHLMDTLANIALSAEAHNYEWISTISAPPSTVSLSSSVPSLSSFHGVPGGKPWYPTTCGTRTGSIQSVQSVPVSLPIPLPPKKHHTAQFRKSQPVPPAQIVSHHGVGVGGMMLNPLVAEQTLFQASGASRNTGLLDSELL